MWLKIIRESKYFYGCRPLPEVGSFVGTSVGIVVGYAVGLYVGSDRGHTQRVQASARDQEISNEHGPNSSPPR